jgi:hypothetical protein
MRQFMSLSFMLCLCFGCQKAAPKQAQPVDASLDAAASAPAAKDQPAAPRLILDGKAVELTNALAYSRGSSRITVKLSNVAMSCDEERSVIRPMREGARSITLDFAPVVQADGTRRWSPTELVLSPRTIRPGLDPSVLAGLTITPPIADQPIQVQLDHQSELPADDFLKLPAERLELRGAASAPSCGVIADEVTGSIDQNKLTASLAGKPLAFQGAVLTGPAASPSLVLTTSPRDCAHWRSNDAELTITLTAEDGKHPIRTSGDIFTSQHNDWPTVAELGLKRDAADPTAITFDGGYTVMDLPLVLRGQVKAVDCTKR